METGGGEGERDLKLLKLFAKKLESMMEFSPHDRNGVGKSIAVIPLSLEILFFLHNKNPVAAPCLEDFKNRSDFICLEWSVSALALGKVAT